MNEVGGKNNMEVSISEHFSYKKLIKFVLPCIGMMIITSIYSIVDGYFVSNFAGKNAFAAVNLVMPILMAIGSFGFMIGTGGSALVAYIFGTGDREKGKQVFTMLVAFMTIVGLIIAALAIIFMPNIVSWLGASDLIRDDSIIYGRILMCSLTAFMLQNAYQSFLVTAEKANIGLLVSLSAGILNIVLDFVLVYFFELGIIGAAFATALSEFLGAIIPTIYFFTNTTSSLRFTKFKFEWKMILKASSNGISEMVTNLSASVVSIIFNFQLMKLAAENGLAAYGVIMYIGFIFQSVFFGYAIGINPVIGYNYGAENKSELSNILRKSLFLTSITGIVMFLSCQILAGQIADLYVGYDLELYNITTTGLRIYAFAFLFSGVNIFASAFFTGLNNGKISAVISMIRTLVVQVIAVITLPILFGIRGIWMAVGVAEVITLALALGTIAANRKKYGY